MPTHFFISAKSGNKPDFAEKTKKNILKKGIFKYVGIFHPSGEPISQHQLRCSLFAVVHYSFMGYFLAAAAISARE
jgi:hypothetical protein